MLDQHSFKLVAPPGNSPTAACGSGALRVYKVQATKNKTVINNFHNLIFKIYVFNCLSISSISI